MPAAASCLMYGDWHSLYMSSCISFDIRNSFMHGILVYVAGIPQIDSLQRILSHIGLCLFSMMSGAFILKKVNYMYLSSGFMNLIRLELSMPV